MNKERIVAALNEDISLELAAILQYLLHEYMAEGLESAAVIEVFDKFSRAEMKHLEKFAERVVYLGGEPTTRVGKIRKGGDLRKMVEDDLTGENEAIAQYKVHIKLAAEEGDSTTRLMLEEIVSDEEGHANTWESVLGKPRQ